MHRYVLPAMVHSANLGVPASYLNVYGGWELAALALAGIVDRGGRGAAAGGLGRPDPHRVGAARGVTGHCRTNPTVSALHGEYRATAARIPIAPVPRGECVVAVEVRGRN